VILARTANDALRDERIQLKLCLTVYRKYLFAGIRQRRGEHSALGSANLSDKALAINPELGVIIRDPDTVGRIVSHCRSLMQPGTGVLEHYSADG
jgi:phosphatidylserine/phosphatidylglycerophosphate/cardiolipin synthase-like enzyme